VKYTAVTCPNCGAPLGLATSRSITLCPYCGTSLRQKESKGGATSKTEGWLKLAEEAEASRNVEKAYRYYTMILEIELDNAQAWFGKAKAASRLSTITQPRLEEMIVGIENALIYAPEQTVNGLIEDAVYHIKLITRVFFNRAHTWISQCSSTRYGREWQEAWATYMRVCGQILSALQVAHRLDSKDIDILSEIVRICRINIRGIEHQVIGGWPRKERTIPNYDYTEWLRRLVHESESKIKEIDPNYKPKGVPTVRRKSGCFIATATLGDPEHPTVMLLRQFRDQWLSTNAAGRAFVRLYYSVGPLAAAPISRSTVLRTLSYHLIVQPASFVAGRLLGS
jgi:uncharacterized Zn finger protein (UPF0148 family)